MGNFPFFFKNTERRSDIKERGSRTTTDLAPLSFCPKDSLGGEGNAIKLSDLSGVG